MAHDIHDTFTLCTNTHDIYFPLPDSEQRFLNTVNNRCFHNLQTIGVNAFYFLEKYQLYKYGNNDLLRKMVDLVNKKKHDQLTPQSRTEIKSLEIRPPGGSIKMGPGSSISGFGQISSGGATINLQGDSISPDNPAKSVIGPVQQKVTTWVSFEFDEIKEPVFPFLDNILSYCQLIFDDYRQLGKS